MAGVDYCTVLPSWDFDRDPACVVNYLFDSIDGPYDENGESGEQATDGINFSGQCLVLERTTGENNGEEDRESCCLSITCKPHYRVTVLGVDIISESRSLEVYDTSEGYLTTTRGSRIPCTDGEGGEDCSNIYRCKIKLKNTMYGLSVKFPCTVNMQKFVIHQVKLILNPEAEDQDDLGDNGSFNLDKVKNFIDTENMSTGAQDLLKTMEQYQQNKRSALSGLQGMMVGGAASSGPGVAGLGLMGLMSVFSNMADSHSTSRAATNQTGTNQPSVPPTVPCSDSLRGHNSGLPAEEDDSGMFRILQDICGKVSELRTADQEETTLDNQETLQVNDISLSEEDNIEEDDKKVVDEQTVERIVTDCLQGVEDRLRTHIDNKLLAMEDRINTQLDKILAVLNRNPDSESGENS